MPGRQSHGALPSKKPRIKYQSKKRALNAFSIASHENPEKIKIRQHRLGTTDGAQRNAKKRARENEDELEDDEDDGGRLGSQKQRKTSTAKGRFDELDIDEGSDSEGNEWKLGQVDSDDDSDLDSDAAFGESDEERFEGFTFGGGENNTDRKKRKAPEARHVNLHEEQDSQDSNSELEDGDLGEDAIDLATMLDQTAVEDEAPAKNQSELEADDSDTEDAEEDSEESDEESSISSAENDENDPAKLAALQDLIANLPQASESSRGPARQRSDGANEYSMPSDFGLTSKLKLTLEDLGLPAIRDPQIKKSLKYLDTEATGSGSRKIPGKLEVPLAKRQLDRLDRSAAYDKSKETLARWTDTVKHNRRADHLMFPLVDHDLESAKSNKQLQPIVHSKPYTELEATIQSILEESGLAAADGKDAEDHIREFEELQTNKMSLEEVKARRDQLRMARELMFREETKAKRIKKIKSKSYRKVHRKQREKEERLNKEALAEGGFVPSEDEQEGQDRRRAVERVSQKHRGGKWAKSAGDRAAWDEDARAGITEMARRDEELRKRVEGRNVRKEFEDDSEESLSESDVEGSGDDEAVEQKRLLRRLDKVAAFDHISDSAPGSRLANMKFMQKADAARKKANDEMVEEIRRELAGEESPSEEEADGDIGRRLFGPGKSRVKQNVLSASNEFAEPAGSEDDVGASEAEFHGLDDSPIESMKTLETKKSNETGKSSKPLVQASLEETSGGAWSKVTSKTGTISDAEAKRRRHKKNDAIEIEELDLSKAAVITKPPKAKKSERQATTLHVESDSEGSDDENAIRLPFAIRDQELIKRAFAGADVVGEFEAEKKQNIEDEDEKIIDNTLPGWGNWVGDGVSKKELARNKGRFLTKTEGIKAHNRKDAKLDRVIINQKRVKKNGKYLASSLPHPFETRQQYERSLRLPVGPEWTTKETLQDATKPRVLLKQGVIAPMSKPLL